MGEREWIAKALLVAALAAGGTEALWRAGVLPRADAVVSDAWHRLRGHSHHEEPPVVLIRVDDETLRREPDPFIFWAPKFATAITNLREAGATVIGVDFLFAASAERWLAEHGFEELSRTQDAPLLAALAGGGVVLGASYGHDEQGVHLETPLGPFAFVLGEPRDAMGIDGLTLDADSVVRRWVPSSLAAADGGGSPVHTFALTLVLRHLQLPTDQATWEIAGRTVSIHDPPEPIAWDGPARSHEGLPFWRLLDGVDAEEKSLLDGKIAIIGSDHAGSYDVFSTPYGSGMAGAEVHANIVSTLLGGRRVHALDPAARILLLLAASSALSLLAFRARLPVTVGALAVAELAWPIGGFVAFDQAAVLVPAASGGLSAMLVMGGAWAFRFGREEAERRRLRRVFERYVSDAIVEDILSTPGKLDLGGARREMTVLFSDIQGFTTISERLTPEEVVEMLNEYFGRVCRPILDSGGVVDKFVGDAVMAVWGVPVATSDHARRAIQAALEMSAAVESFKGWYDRRFAGRDLPEFDVGIGLHTGQAVAGNIGFERRTEYTVIGDAVNVASRVEGLTRKVGCRILVTRATLDAAGPGISTGRDAELAVKGRDRPVQVFEVVGLLEGSHAVRDAARDPGRADGPGEGGGRESVG